MNKNPIQKMLILSILSVLIFRIIFCILIYYFTNKLIICEFFMLTIIDIIIIFIYSNWIKDLYYKSCTDELTGVYNRQFIYKSINKLNNTNFIMLFIDIDDFKIINDTFGHSIGDEILQQIASKFVDLIRDSDYVIRWGGDEFIILLKDITINEGKIIADRIIREIKESTFKINDKIVKTSISVGLSNHNIGEDFNECVNNSDFALYQAKENKNSIKIFKSKEGH